jgi:tripartite-type tricarboxylate transporter receptor subunit TctC
MLTSLVLTTGAAADDWPSKPVTVILTGSADAAPRIVGDAIASALGQQLVMESRPGASGTIAADYTLRRPADGYTFLNATSALMAAPNTFEIDYDVLEDFTPVSLLATSPFILVAHPSLPVHSLAELVALARKRPKEIDYSSTSPGSSSSLTAAAFKAAAHIDIVQIPYRTMGTALLDVIAGQVQLCMSVGPNAVSQIKAGRIRPLAVSTPKRSAVLPDIPSFTELGYPQVDVTAWYGLIARAGTPPEIIERLSKLVIRALQDPEVRKKYLVAALEPVGDTPREFGEFMKADLARWQRAAKAANLGPKKKRPVR